ncbi:MAG: hypothetical protein RR190_03045 [Bacteroidales bacterium]
MSSLLPSFFQVRKPRSFSYKPLYYSEREEHLNELKKEAEAENADTEFDLTSAERELRLRKKMERYRPQKKSEGLLSTKKILIYLGILLLFIVYFLK